MKQFILILLSILSIKLQAQCVQTPSCINEVVMTCNDLSNQYSNGNTCFSGYGSIPTSYNWNGQWNWFQFNSTIASIGVEQSLNLGNGAKKVFTSGAGGVNFFGNFSMDGGDTLVVGTGCTTQVTYPISNNSNPGQKNVIILNPGAILYVGLNMAIYEPGDTIKTVPGNNSNNIYVIACYSVPLQVKIEDFSLNGNALNWTVNNADQIKIEYSVDQKSWNPVYSTSINKGSFGIVASGYYRLNADGEYSKTIVYTHDNVSSPKRVYYYMGNYYTDTKYLPYYGVPK